MTLKELCEQLESKIQSAYTEGLTLESAERLAFEFLHGQLQVSKALKVQDLDRRMKKSGVKAIRAAVRLDILRKEEKKPTESTIDAMVDSDKLIIDEQNSFDASEVEKEELERYFSVFHEAHIHCRGVAKGNFGG